MRTTKRKSSAVRHIPEEELHAYLDQALSRSQCVEIERHLARCSRCQGERDRIAGLRDRTTELLARLGPPLIVPPAFTVLKARRHERLRRRRQWIVAGGWAASVAGALLLGWRVNSRSHLTLAPGSHPSIAVASLPQSPLPTPVPSPARPSLGSPAATTGSVEAPSSERGLVRSAESRDERSMPIRFARAIEADPAESMAHTRQEAPQLALANADAPELSAAPVGADPALQGIWRTILPDSSAGPDGTGDVPRVPGLPIVRLRVQPGDGGTEVTAVDQLLESGEVIRTIAGPALRVGSLVARESAAQSVAPTDNGDTRMTVTIRQGDRMVAVTGPSQALGSLLSRVNLKRRRY